MNKTKLMCVYSRNPYFTKGKIYKGYEKGNSFIVDDAGYIYDTLECDKIAYSTFISLNKIRRKVICISSLKSPIFSFSCNEYYFVDQNENIYDDNGNRIKYFEGVYEGEYFKTVVNCIEEEKKMTNLEKDDLVKGIDKTMVQDMFRAVTSKKKGMIQFNPVTMVHVCFVRFPDNSKIYIFENPSDKRLKPNTKVRVHTRNKDQEDKDAYVVCSLKIQRKYLKDLKSLINNHCNYLESIIGIYETVEETVKTENLVKLTSEQ